MSREVIEDDFRKDEYKGKDPAEYEFRRGDDVIVRKDRFETGMLRVAIALGFNSREGYEIDDVVALAEEYANKINGGE